jgi:hypothetical protein
MKGSRPEIWRPPNCLPREHGSRAMATYCLLKIWLLEDVKCCALIEKIEVFLKIRSVTCLPLPRAMPLSTPAVRKVNKASYAIRLSNVLIALPL